MANETDKQVDRDRQMDGNIYWLITHRKTDIHYILTDRDQTERRTDIHILTDNTEREADRQTDRERKTDRQRDIY